MSLRPREHSIRCLPEEARSALECISRAQMNALRRRAGQERRGAAKAERQSHFGHHKPRLGRASLQCSGVPLAPTVERLLKERSSSQQRTGYDLADFQGIEIQTFVELVGETESLSPGVELAKLLFDNGAGLLLDSATDDSAVTPKLSREGKTSTHGFLQVL